MAAGTQRVLFICTGNYYRSRFAELLFNDLARRCGLVWQATSRGTDVVGSRQYLVGPISPVTRQALEERGIALGPDIREPLQLAEQDLTGAALVVAVCETEHRPHLERDFPAAATRVEYWNVDDLAITPARDGTSALELHVHQLVERLHRNVTSDARLPADSTAAGSTLPEAEG